MGDVTKFKGPAEIHTESAMDEIKDFGDRAFNGDLQTVQGVVWGVIHEDGSVEYGASSTMSRAEIIDATHQIQFQEALASMVEGEE